MKDPFFGTDQKLVSVTSTRMLPVSAWSGTANTLSACAWTFARNDNVGVFQFRLQIAATVNSWVRFALGLPGEVSGFQSPSGAAYLGGGIASYGAGTGNLSVGEFASLFVYNDSQLYIYASAANTRPHVRGTYVFNYNVG